MVKSLAQQKAFIVKIRLLFLLMFFMTNVGLSQSIGGDNSRWVFDLFNGDGITEMEFSKDTIIDSLLYDKYELTTTRIDPRNGDTLRRAVDPIFISNQNGLALYQWTRLTTDTLYNFNADIGDSWSVKDRTKDIEYAFTVLDTFRTDINGRRLFSMSYEMGMVNSTPSFVDTVYETIGNKYSFIIPYDIYNGAVVIGNQGGTVRCFRNDDLGLVQLDNSEFNGVSTFSPFQYDCDRLTSNKNIELDVDNYVNVFPNPVYDILHIESNNPQNCILYNQQVLKVPVKHNIHNSTLDLSQLESGIYFLKIGNFVRRVMKI